MQTLRVRSSSSIRERLAATVIHRRAVLLAMAAALLLSGCVLSPLFQAPAIVLSGIAVLLGLAACGGGGGGGGGGSGDGGGGGGSVITFPRFVNLDDLTGTQFGMVLAGQYGVGGDGKDYAGRALAAGDLDGDGIIDVAIGAEYFQNEVGSRGKVHVIFGDSTGGGLWGEGGIRSLSDLSGGNDSRGWTIVGNGDENIGTSLAIANFTTSSHADLAIGMPGVQYTPYWGAAWLVHGGDGTDVGNRLTTFESGVGGGAATLIYNNQKYPYYNAGLQQLIPSQSFGISVAAVDISGDGLADLLIGAPYASNAYDNCYGQNLWALPKVVTLFSGSDGEHGWGEFGYNAVFDSATGGFTFAPQTSMHYATGSTPAAAVSYLGLEIVNLGDINGDGHPDVAIVQPYGGEVGGRSVHVIFGRSSASGFPTSYGSFTGNNGFLIFDSSNTYGGGTSHQEVSVAAAGDVNGDGVADFLVSHRRSNRAPYYGGRTFIVFGHGGESPPWTDGSLDLSALEAGQGVELIAPAYVELSALAAGDVNGDGVNDVLIVSDNAQMHRYNGEASSFYTYNTGVVFVVFGGSSLTSQGSLYLGEMGVSQGFAAFGPYQGHITGPMLVADVNGDTFPDLLVAGTQDYYNYATSSTVTGSRVFVVFGQNPASSPEIPADTSSQLSITVNSWD